MGRLARRHGSAIPAAPFDVAPDRRDASCNLPVCRLIPYCISMTNERSAAAVPEGILFDRGLLQVAGSDARSFLQGLLTNDIDRTDGGGVIHAALLSPQGKILFEFLIGHDRRNPAGDGDAFLLDVREDDLADLGKRLAFYRLRAKVAITEYSARLKVAVDFGRRHGSADPRSPELPHRFHVTADTPLPAAQGYDRLRIAAGVAELGKDFKSGEVFPHEALLDQMGSVDFKKGCYIGQEVVSRTEHRGSARSRYMIAAAESDLPVGDNAITAGGQPVATLCSRCGRQGLALTRIDRLRRAVDAGERPRLGDVEVTLTRPPFATFELAAGDAA